MSEIGWIEERAVRDRALAAHLRRHLHDGEAEAIVLALESRAELLLMDERVGRRLAVRAGLKVTGVLGALIEAKQRGAITAVRPVLDQLMVKAGFWVAAGLYARVVREAGE